MSLEHSSAALQPYYTPVTLKMHRNPRHLTMADSVARFHTNDKAEEEARKKKRLQIWPCTTPSTARVRTTNGLCFKHSPREISVCSPLLLLFIPTFLTRPFQLPLEYLQMPRAPPPPDFTPSHKYGPDYHLGTTVQRHTANNPHVPNKEKNTGRGKSSRTAKTDLCSMYTCIYSWRENEE